LSRKALWCVAAAVLGSPADADDVVQEAAMVALSKEEERRRVTNVPAWLAQITRFVALNHRRAGRRGEEHRREAAATKSEVGGELAVEPRPVDSRGSLMPGQRSFDDAMTRALEGLDDTARACLLLRVVLEMTYEQISAILGVPAGTAMSHVHRSKRRLLEHLTTVNNGRPGPGGAG
jgi:RNA polymerase sigma-70 factor (ECF subfamily)